MMPNPAVIPILDAADPNMATKCAVISVTYTEPGNVDPAWYFWKIKSGPVAFFGDPQGKDTINVYGTGNSAADVEAKIELRLKNATGPLLCTFRAWVGPIKTITYRANIR